MAQAKQEQKTVVLLSPHRLLKDQQVLQALQIIKSATGISYKEEELNNSTLRNFFENYPKQAKDALSWFSQAGMQTITADIKKTFAIKKAGLAFEKYFNNAMMSKLHELFSSLRPFAADIKWYHKLPQEAGRFKTAPCFLNGSKPRLKFEVIDNNGLLELQTIIVIEETTADYKNFERFHFLLLRSNEYFVLNHKDCQTLEWLKENNPQQYGHQPQEFAQHILVKLEADYSVKRNNLFDKKKIEVVPVNRIMLSEISQSFLMLTPQWNYDGIIAEGAWQPVFEFTRNGEQFSVERNKEQEKNFVELLESLHKNFSKQLNGYYYLSFDEAQKKQWFLKVYHRMLEMNVEVIGMDMLQHFRYSSHKAISDVVIANEDDKILSLQVTITFGKEKIPLPELQKTIRAGQRTLLLNDGSLGVLDDDWQQQYAAIFRHGKITDTHTIEVPRWLAFAEQNATEETQVLKPVIKKVWWQKWQQWQRSDEPVYTIPSTVKASLRPYQQKGFEWMALLAEAGAGACLADDMGLGKTLQTICFLSHQSQQHKNAKHLVICPSSLIYNWQQELQKFSPLLKALVYHGAGRDAGLLQSSVNDVIITSYGTVRADAEQFAAVFLQPLCWMKVIT